ncbi:MAG: hypothetical protein H6701_10495 [Myxococcales bacterium]|nr:hypothetical protein [Myxococcales bacterium]
MTALAIVGEDATHAALIDGLLKQTLREAALDAGIAWVVDALDAEMPIIEWLGADAVELGRHAVRYFERDKVAKQLKGQHGASMVRGRAVKTHGFIQGRPLGPSAKVWRRALIAVFSDERVEGVIAAEDTDGDPAKLDGLRQAAALFDGALVVCAPHQAPSVAVLGAGSPQAAKWRELLRVGEFWSSVGEEWVGQLATEEASATRCSRSSVKMPPTPHSPALSAP